MRFLKRMSDSGSCHTPGRSLCQLQESFAVAVGHMEPASAAPTPKQSPQGATCPGGEHRGAVILLSPDVPLAMLGNQDGPLVLLRPGSHCVFSAGRPRSRSSVRVRPHALGACVHGIGEDVVPRSVRPEAFQTHAAPQRARTQGREGPLLLAGTKGKTCRMLPSSSNFSNTSPILLRIRRSGSISHRSPQVLRNPVGSIYSSRRSAFSRRATRDRWRITPRP